MIDARTISVTACAVAVASCGIKVQPLSEENRIRKQGGFTHTVSTDVLRLRNSDAGYSRLFRSALRVCSLPQDSDPMSIRFERIIAAYSLREYAFDCKEPGKVSQ